MLIFDGKKETSVTENILKTDMYKKFLQVTLELIKVQKLHACQRAIKGLSVEILNVEFEHGTYKMADRENAISNLNINLKANTFKCYKIVK